MISTNFLPNEPVPPVTRTTCSDQLINYASQKLNLIPIPFESESTDVAERAGRRASLVVPRKTTNCKYIGDATMVISFLYRN